MEATNTSLSLIKQSACHVESLKNEMSDASEELSEEIELITKALLEMESVKQKNPLNADEFAATTGALNSRTDLMKEVVKEIQMILYGSKTRSIPGKNKDSGVQDSAAALLPQSSNRINCNNRDSI